MRLENKTGHLSDTPCSPVLSLTQRDKTEKGEETRPAQRTWPSRVHRKQRTAGSSGNQLGLFQESGVREGAVPSAGFQGICLSPFRLL